MAITEEFTRHTTQRNTYLYNIIDCKQYYYYTSFGRCALPLAVRRPGARTSGIVVYQAGWTRHLVGHALHAIDELIADSLVPMLVVAVGSGTAFRRFRFLCAGINNDIINNNNVCSAK